MTTPVGQVTLPIRFGEKGQPTRMILETFKIVDCPSEYNAILGRTALYKLRGAVSIFHYSIKFPTSDGEGTHRGDQREARECVLTIPRTKINAANFAPEAGTNITISREGEEGNRMLGNQTGSPLLITSSAGQVAENAEVEGETDVEGV